MKSTCIPCEYKYDLEQGDLEGEISPGTPFEDILEEPEKWAYRVCSVTKDQFKGL